MDLPQKEELKRRWQERQESQAKAASEDIQMKMQLEEIKNQNSNISFKDAPPEIQYAMAAKQGLVPKEVADYVMQLAIQAQFPELAQQQQLQQMQQEFSPEVQQPPEDLDKMIALSQMNQPRQQSQGGNLTQPAVESLIRGITPAM